MEAVRKFIDSLCIALLAMFLLLVINSIYEATVGEGISNYILGAMGFCIGWLVFGRESNDN